MSMSILSFWVYGLVSSSPENVLSRDEWVGTYHPCHEGAGQRGDAGTRTGTLAWLCLLEGVVHRAVRTLALLF